MKINKQIVVDGDYGFPDNIGFIANSDELYDINGKWFVDYEWFDLIEVLH